MFLGINVSWALVRSRFKPCLPSSLWKACRRTKCHGKFTATNCLLAGLRRKIHPHGSGTSRSCQKSGQSWLERIIVGHPICCTEDSWDMDCRVFHLSIVIQIKRPTRGLVFDIPPDRTLVWPSQQTKWPREQPSSRR